MYSLFKFKKLLSLPGLRNKGHANIISSSFVETSCWYMCALACTNGYIILYYQQHDESEFKPIVRQIPWLHHPYKEIKSICFDPSSKCWLLIATEDTSLYILPALTIVNPYARVEEIWSIDDITHLSLSNQRSPPTAVVWWRTYEDEPMAIVGHELGEITFVNLKLNQEVGGTFIPFSVKHMNIIQNEKKNKTFLLITGVTETQWLLLLEDISSLFYWPGEADFFSGQSSGYEDRSANICGSQKSDMVSSFDLQPQRIVKYEGISKIVPHYTSLSTFLSVTPHKSSQISLHDWSLKDTPISVNNVPANSEQFIVSDKVIFCIETDKNFRKLTLVSKKISTVPPPNDKKQKKEEDPVLQTFSFSDVSNIISIFRVRSNGLYDENDNLSDGFSTIYSNHSCSEMNFSQTSSRKTRSRNDDKSTEYYYIQNSSSRNSQSQCSSRSSRYQDSISDYTQIGQHSFCDSSSLDGCLIITQNALYICKQRTIPESIIFSLLSGNDKNYEMNTISSNLEAAEKLAAALELDIRPLYEDAADYHLGCGRFTEALKLLQLSQCPQLKRVATFASQGCLAELLTYIRMLFSSNIIDIAAPDRRHFANLIIHCFVHQLLDTQMNRKKLRKAFWTFLDLNCFYDDDVAVRLLVDHGFYDSLYHLVKIHGLHHKMLEILVSSYGPECHYYSEFKDALLHMKCESMYSRFNNDLFLKCISMKELGLILLMNPYLVSSYLNLISKLIPKLNDKVILMRIARVLDFTDQSSKFFLHKVSSKYRKRMRSISSLTSFGSETFDFINSTTNEINVDEIAETFIKCLLRLNQISDPNHHDFNLINMIDLPPSQVPSSPCSDDYDDQLQVKPTILSCGEAHAALIRNGCIYTWGKTKHGRLGHNISPSKTEKMLPKMVGLLLRHRVTVKSVSCGAQHTMAVTSHGVYAWGSSGFGQLGLGNLLRSTQPMIIEDFLMETVLSVVCGQYHSLALMADGRLYSWGWGVHGQLGHGDAINLSRAKLIDPKSIGGRIIQVSAGHSHTIVLNAQGELYSFGCGLFGQLGKGSVHKETYPRKINLPEPVCHVATGFFHSIALTCSNKVYTWGMNPQTLKVQAQMIKKMRGHKHHVRHQPTLKEVASAGRDFNNSHLVPVLLDTSLIDGRIKYVACGGAHTALLSIDGEVFTFGRNLDGQLGIGSKKEMRTPTLLISISELRITEISCGPDYTIALDSTGRLWGWGRNDQGQLGIEEPEPILGMSKPFPGTVKVVKIKSTRRMIHLKQGRNAEILKPVELSWLPRSSETNTKFNDASQDEILSPIKQYRDCHPIMEVPFLCEVETPPFGISTLHLALQYLYLYYNSSSVMHHCLSSHNFQATAKVCMLEGAYHKAIMYQLHSLENQEKIDNLAESVCAIINSYISHIDANNLQNMKIFLEHILKFWIKHSLDIRKIESLLTSHSTNVFPALAVILFSSKDEEGNDLMIDNSVAVATHENILKELSTDFCLSIVLYVINQTEGGLLSQQYVEQLVGPMAYKLLIQDQSTLRLSWEAPLSTEDLWQAILQNLSKDHEQAIVLPSSAVSSLNRALTSSAEDVPPTANKNEYLDGSFVTFTCGHHYTTYQYRTNIIPSFQQSLSKLPACIPRTISLMLSMYNAEELCPAACPRCALASLQQELS